MKLELRVKRSEISENIGIVTIDLEYGQSLQDYIDNVGLEHIFKNSEIIKDYSCVNETEYTLDEVNEV